MKKLVFFFALLLMAGLAFGQTIKKGAVVGAYPLTITLDPDVTMNQFVDFTLNKTIPAWEKHLEGVKIFIMKGYSGDHKGGYGMIIFCESMEIYKKYWNEKGEPTELLKGLMEKELKPIQDEQKKLGWMSWDFTDWVVL